MRSAIAAALIMLAGCEQKTEEPELVTADLEGSPTDSPPPVPDNAAIQPVPKPPTPPTSTEPGTVPATPPQHFQALGTEPFWSFEVLPGKLIYTSPEVQQGIVIAARFSGQGKRLQFSGAMQGKPVLLAIEPGTCSDGMSDTVYAYKASFSWGGQTEQGCARLK